MIEIITLEQAKATAEAKCKRDENAWQSYLDRNIDTLCNWVNKRLVNSVDTNTHMNGFEICLDYTFMFDLFGEQPPFEKKQGIEIFAAHLLNRIRANGDWEVDITSNLITHVRMRVKWSVPIVEEPAKKKKDWKFWPVWK